MLDNTRIVLLDRLVNITLNGRLTVTARFVKHLRPSLDSLSQTQGERVPFVLLEVRGEVA